MQITAQIRAYVLVAMMLLGSMAAAWGGERIDLDSLMSELYALAPVHDKTVRHYESVAYVKGRLHPLKVNRLLVSVPGTMRFDRKSDDYIVESISELNFTEPWMHDRKVIAINGTFRRVKPESDALFQYFNTDIYKETMMGDHLLSPFVGSNARFYVYELDSVARGNSYISFRPKYSNTELVEGSFVLDNRDLLVEEVEMKGKFEFMDFTLKVTMGTYGYERYVPQKHELDFLFKFVGNKIKGEYTCVQSYKKFDKVSPPRGPKRVKYDLTDRFRLQTDTAEYKVDSALVARSRLQPLLAEEQKLYDDYAIIRDSLAATSSRWQSPNAKFWQKVGSAFIADYSWRFSNNREKIKMSPILNPVLLEYSKSRGYAYMIDLRYTSDRPSGRYMRIAPRVGYNFTFKEWNWRVRSSYLYYPRRGNTVELEVGSGRRVYSDVVIDQLKPFVPDSIDMYQMNLDVFTESYVKLRHKMELINGMDLSAGVLWRRYDPDRLPPEEWRHEYIRQHYSSFALNLRLEYTHKQYYYWNNNRKVDVYSPYPTFSIDWEHGFPHVLGSNGSYDRWEVEMNYTYKTNVFNRISYQVGGGIFAHRSATAYFADFNNFRHSHLPVGWNDELGGTFQTLQGRWYNSANEYVRGHITYESPMFALTRLRGLTHSIQAERLYLSALLMPKLHPFVELGYGFATHVIDVGAFMSFRNWEFNSVGLKFSLQLFR